MKTSYANAIAVTALVVAFGGTASFAWGSTEGSEAEQARSSIGVVQVYKKRYELPQPDTRELLRQVHRALPLGQAGDRRRWARSDQHQELVSVDQLERNRSLTHPGQLQGLDRERQCSSSRDRRVADRLRHLRFRLNLHPPAATRGLSCRRRLQRLAGRDGPTACILPKSTRASAVVSTLSLVRTDARRRSAVRRADVHPASSGTEGFAGEKNRLDEARSSRVSRSEVVRTPSRARGDRVGAGRRRAGRSRPFRRLRESERRLRRPPREAPRRRPPRTRRFRCRWRLVGRRSTLTEGANLRSRNSLTACP